MKVAIVVNGTRGDVQPMLALAVGLIGNGHTVILCANPENEELIKRYNCPFVPFGPNYKEIFKQKSEMKGGASISPSLKDGKEEIMKQINLLPAILNGSDIVLGVGFVFGVQTVADILKIPFRLVVFYPVLLGTTKYDPFFNRLMFGFGRSVINLMMKGFINKKRKEAGLKPIHDVWEYWLGENVIVACDKELNAASEGVSFKFTQTGFMMLPSQSMLPENVNKFICEGKPPIYIGFGSIPVSHPEKFDQIFKDVSKATGQRLIISKGWAELPENNSSDILYVDEMPFEFLFPRMAAIVFNGGAGTMAAAARAGIPQIAFPFMADQFENRKQIVKLGLGPKACDFKKISANHLSSAIIECVTNENYKKSAVEISKKLQNANGLELTVRLLEKEIIK